MVMIMLTMMMMMSNLIWLKLFPKHGIISKVFERVCVCEREEGV